ncbi:hypothetical protein D3C74_59570 [compost metagenome]
MMIRKLFSFIIVLSLSLLNSLSVFANEQSVGGVTYTEANQTAIVQLDPEAVLGTPTENLHTDTQVTPQAIGVGQVTLKRVDGSNNVYLLSVSLLMPEVITDLQFRVNWGDGAYTTGSGSEAVGKRTWSRNITLVYDKQGVYKPTVNIQVKTKSGLWQQINISPPNVAVVN